MNRPRGPLNYHHLRYFWAVARAGTIARASAELHLTQPAISAQLAALQRTLGEALFLRAGRRLVLTDVGRMVYRYADEIFSLGRELEETLAGRPGGRAERLVVGAADAVPKLVVARFLAPLLRGPEPAHLILREDKTDRLLSDLSLHALDVVVTDTPVPPAGRPRAFHHLLGECGITIFGAPSLGRLRAAFPRGLDGAPFLLPTENTAMRQSMEQWFQAARIRPRVVAEIEDSAVLKTFGQAGAGFFAAPTLIEREVGVQYQVRPVGRSGAVRERFYAVTVERRITHPLAERLLRRRS